MEKKPKQTETFAGCVSLWLRCSDSVANRIGAVGKMEYLLKIKNKKQTNISGKQPPGEKLLLVSLGSAKSGKAEWELWI